MARVELAPEVLDDLDRFFDHMAKFAVEDAPQRIAEIVDAVQILTHGPSIGAKVWRGKGELVIGSGARGYVVEGEHTTMTSDLAVVSSMATKQLLADLVPLHEEHAGSGFRVVSVGGVEAARRVQAGEAFDIAVLASDAIDGLIAAGRVAAGSKADLVRSAVAIAVRRGASRPDIVSEAALRDALLSARTVGYSTGPSDVALQRLFDRWGIAKRFATAAGKRRPAFRSAR